MYPFSKTHPTLWLKFPPLFSQYHPNDQNQLMAWTGGLMGVIRSSDLEFDKSKTGCKYLGGRGGKKRGGEERSRYYVQWSQPQCDLNCEHCRAFESSWLFKNRQEACQSAAASSFPLQHFYLGNVIFCFCNWNFWIVVFNLAQYVTKNHLDDPDLFFFFLFSKYLLIMGYILPFPLNPLESCFHQDWQMESCMPLCKLACLSIHERRGFPQ